jgi:hypothetical protein
LESRSLGLFLAHRKVAIEAELDLLQDFRNELATLHGVQEVRQLRSRNAAARSFSGPAFAQPWRMTSSIF